MKKYLVVKPDRCVRKLVHANYIEYNNGAVLFYRHNYENGLLVNSYLYYILTPGTYVSVVEKE
jgi:hypothetical protein